MAIVIIIVLLIILFLGAAGDGCAGRLAGLGIVFLGVCFLTSSFVIGLILIVVGLGITFRGD